MTRTSDSIYLEGLDVFGSVVERYPSDGWDRPSPCTGWRALDVLGHVGATTGFGIELLRGGTPSWQPPERPGEQVEGDPVAWWRALAGRARELVAAADLTRAVDTPAGPRTVAEGLTFPAIDLFVHAWDLGRSAGIDVEIPDDVTEFAHAVIDALPREQVRSPRVFADEHAAPPGATRSESFLAWTGRDPRWQAE